MVFVTNLIKCFQGNENHERTSSNSIHNGNHGDEVKINHNKETGESGGKKKIFLDEDDHSSNHHKQKQFSNDGKFKAKKDQKRRKSEKGMYLKIRILSVFLFF